MAPAQLLKVTNTIDNRVEEIVNNVLVVDNRVVCIDDRVAGVDERVAGVDDRVKDVDDQLKIVNDKSVTVIGGARYIFNQSSEILQLLTRLGGKEARGVVQQTADDVDLLKRSWFPNHFMLDMQAQLYQQGIKYDKIFVDGSHHLIHLRITILHATPITRERRPGFLKEVQIRNGSQQALSRHSGFMGNVRPCLIPSARCHLITIFICSWLWQEYTLIRRAIAFFVKDN